MLQNKYQQEYNFALKKMGIGGILGAVFVPAIMFLYLYLTDFFIKNCNINEFDYLPNSVYIFMGIIVFGTVGGSLGCCLGLFSKKWAKLNKRDVDNITNNNK